MTSWGPLSGGSGVGSGGTDCAICPLPSSTVGGAASGLCAFSLVYLLYAQHHFVLFIAMTMLVAVLIMILYSAGILAVAYMIYHGYDDWVLMNEEKNATSRSTTIVENTYGGDQCEMQL